MCVCVSPILSGKTVFADCKFYEFDWGAANEPYWRISLSSSSSCRLPADKGRREAVVDQQCGIHEIHFEKGLRKHPEQQKSTLFEFLKNCTTFPPCHLPPELGTEQLSRLEDIEIRQSFTLCQCFFPLPNTNRQWRWMPKFIPNSPPSYNSFNFPNLINFPNSPKSSNFPNLLNSSNPARDS